MFKNNWLVVTVDSWVDEVDVDAECRKADAEIQKAMITLQMKQLDKH